MKHWINTSKHDQNQASIFLPYKGLYQNILGSSSQTLLWSRLDNTHSGNHHKALQNILQIYKQLKFNKHLVSSHMKEFCHLCTCSVKSHQDLV